MGSNNERRSETSQAHGANDGLDLDIGVSSEIGGDLLFEPIEKDPAIYVAVQSGDNEGVLEMVREVVSGKRIALIGFAAVQGHRAAREFERYGATTRLLAHHQARRSAASLEQFDLLVLSVGSGEDLDNWSAPGNEEVAKLPFLVVASPELLQGNFTALRNSLAADFLPAPCQPADLILRAKTMLDDRRTPAETLRE